MHVNLGENNAYHVKYFQTEYFKAINNPLSVFFRQMQIQLILMKDLTK